MSAGRETALATATGTDPDSPSGGATAKPRAMQAGQMDLDGADAKGIGADVTDDAAVKAMLERGVEELGSVDVLVNDAGVGDAGPFLDEGYDEDFRLNIEVHLFGSINCTRAVLDGMIEDGYGKVVNVTSIHTKDGVGMSPQYDAGKFGLLGLTRSLALELGREGIRVTAVAPGWVDTRMTEGFAEAVREQITERNPLGHFADPQDIANAVAFLAAPASDYVNGHELRVDGGQLPIESWRLDDR